MAKKDFLNALAEEIEAEKHGGHSTVMSFDEYSQQVPQRDYSDTDPDEEIRVAEPTPQAAPAPRPKPAPQVVEPAPRPEPVRQTIREGSGFVDDEGPKSFQEEELEKVDKPKLVIKPAAIALILAVLAGIGVLVYFLFFAPKIVVPEFTGQKFANASNWVKQNEIQTSTIVVTREYNFDVEKDNVISQSPEAGKKIKKTTPMTFVVSDGPDPNENIAFPDLKSMAYGEVKEWMNSNKLQKTKISTEYSSTVPQDAVISYALGSNTNEADFTRGTSLTIKISKGEAPAGQVTVEDFTGKMYAEAESWAKNKKVTLVKEEAFDNKVETGKIISQSAKSGTALKEGDTLTLVVSKGKGIAIPDLVGYSETQLETWKASAVGVTVITNGKYNMAAAGTVLNQSIPAGSMVETGTVLVLDTSLYMPQMETTSRYWVGKDYLELTKWCDDVNSKGANIQAGNWEPAGNECSDTQKAGTIKDYWCDGSLSGQDIDQGCGRPLNLDARIHYTIYTGACTLPTPEPTPSFKEVVFKTSDLDSLSAAQSFCEKNGLSCEYCADANTSIDTIYAELTGAGQFNGTLKKKDTFEIMLRVGSDFHMIVHYEAAKPLP